MKIMLRTKTMLMFFMAKSSRFWPFSKISVFVYQLFLKAYLRHCRKFPAIKNVYLSPSFKGAKFTPGLSDLDLVVIISEGLLRKEEYELVNSLRAYQAKLNSLLPVIPDIAILTEKIFLLYLKFNIGDCINLKLLYGKEQAGLPQTTSGDQPYDYLNAAFMLYKHHIADFYGKDRLGNSLDHLCLKRFFFKLLVLASWPESPLSAEFCDKISSRSEMTYVLTQKLHTSAQNYLPETGSFSIDAQQSKIDAPVEIREGLEKLKSIENNLESALYFKKVYYLFYSLPVLYIILKDSLGEKELRRSVSLIRESFSEGFQPLVLTETAFRYMVLSQDPVNYICFFFAGSVLSGKDVRKEIKPSAEAVKKEASREILAYLRFPMSKMFFAGDDFSLALEYILFLKLYLEKNELTFSFGELLDKYDQHYPDLAAKIRRLAGIYLEERLLHYEWFVLFKDISEGLIKGF